MSSEVRFTTLIQFLVLMCILSTHLSKINPNTLQLKYRFCNVWAKLNNTVHCTHGQLFVLSCAADYHSWKDSPFCKYFLIFISRTKWTWAKLNIPGKCVQLFVLNLAFKACNFQLKFAFHFSHGVAFFIELKFTCLVLFHLDALQM